MDVVKMCPTYLREIQIASDTSEEYALIDSATGEK